MKKKGMSKALSHSLSGRVLFFTAAFFMVAVSAGGIFSDFKPFRATHIGGTNGALAGIAAGCQLGRFWVLWSYSTSPFAPPGIEDVYRYDVLGVAFSVRDWTSISFVDADFNAQTFSFVRQVSLTVPWWVLVILLSLFPAIARLSVAVRRWRRSSRGECVNCGYSLVGDISGVCPECGTARRQIARIGEER
jgi:hypothetical protein